MEIKKTEGIFKLSELIIFLEGETILGIHVLPKSCLLVGVHNNSEIKVIDLANKRVLA